MTSLPRDLPKYCTVASATQAIPYERWQVPFGVPQGHFRPRLLFYVDYAQAMANYKYFKPRDSQTIFFLS